jgi:drug/metabolite transporter (DMT)-like permease
MTPSHDLRRGALYMVASALLFAAMSVTVKLASRSLPNATIVFFRNALGLVALLPWLSAGSAGLRTAFLGQHLVRALAGLGAMYCFFYAIAHMPVADAVLLNYSLPLFVPLIERVWLGEVFPERVWLVLGVGFLGIALILRPGAGLFEPAALVGLAAALLAALAQVGIRRLTRSEPVTRIVFYFTAISTAVSALPLLGAWRTPEPALWGLLAALGVLATLAQLLLTRAYACAPAARVGPFIYTAVVFAGLLDWLLWGRLPDRWFALGALLVCGAGILTLRLRTRAAPAGT